MKNVVLISACSKNAIRRTRSVLDRYAFRMGDSVWSTPITQQGLASLLTHLRATASRNTAVLCLHEDRKRGGLTPLWTVGNRARFGDDWRTPVFITEGKARERTRDHSSIPWQNEVKRIAALSGLFHDLGKNNQFFAGKILLEGPLADPIRHEWISARLVEILWKNPGATLDSVWDKAIVQAKNKHLGDDHPLLACDNPFSAALFCVATHHRLLNEEAHSRAPDGSNMLNNGHTHKPGSLDPRLIGVQAAPFPGKILDEVGRKIDRLRTHLNGKPPLYWRAVAFLARTALISADHQVSALRCDQGECSDMRKEAPYANTFKNVQKKRLPNQTLEWHLQSVGRAAATIANNLFCLGESLAGLSPESLSGIDAPAGGRFQWQEEAARQVGLLRQLHPGKPFLLAVVSGTGAGKTRACARLAVRTAADDTVRFTVIFNLRTLTLQTGRAYRDQLHVDAADLAVVVGDPLTRQAEEAYEKPENEDDMDRSLGEDVAVQGSGQNLPEWMEYFVKNNANLKNMLSAPVFVSTADYLVPAGDPCAQGRQTLPLLRLMHSDLILDELDSYEAKSVAAILRLVQLAGLFGRNVIASSATMTPALADALGQFYAHGAAMRAALHGSDQPDFVCGVLSDLASPSLEAEGSSTAFSDLFRQHSAEMQGVLAQKTEVPRRGLLLEMERSETSFYETIKQGILNFHAEHQWADPFSGKPLSVGLVRVANVKTAIALSRYLRENLVEYQPEIACYHSRLLKGHRIMLERDLDEILSRGKRPDAPALHPSVRRHLSLPEVSSGLFVVVATPVEEVGRDHDFDWAILEPSSAQSIVQTAGRVYRHRPGSALTPNIGVLQYNLLACSGKEVAFTRPGNETLDNSRELGFSSHNMAELADWSLLNRSLDARLRFDTDCHPLARADECALASALRDPLQRLTGTGPLWMSEFTYKHWPLREKHSTDEWRYDPEERSWFARRKTKNGWDWLPQSSEAMHSRWIEDRRGWLCPTHKEILQFCDAHEIDQEAAFTVSVPVYGSESSRRKLESGYDGTDFV